MTDAHGNTRITRTRWHELPLAAAPTARRGLTSEFASCAQQADEQLHEHSELDDDDGEAARTDTLAPEHEQQLRDMMVAPAESAVQPDTPSTHDSGTVNLFGTYRRMLAEQPAQAAVPSPQVVSPVLAQDAATEALADDMSPAIASSGVSTRVTAAPTPSVAGDLAAACEMSATSDDEVVGTTQPDNGDTSDSPAADLPFPQRQHTRWHTGLSPDSDGSAESYVPATELDTSGSSSDLTPLGMFDHLSPMWVHSAGSSASATHADDRFVRNMCRHDCARRAAQCVRATVGRQVGHAVTRTQASALSQLCLQCGEIEAATGARLRGCIRCLPTTGAVVTAVLAGSPAPSPEQHGTVGALSTSGSSASTATTVRTPAQAEAYENDVAQATASMHRLLENAPDGVLSTEDETSIRDVIQRLSYSPGAVHAEVHEQRPVMAAIPTIIVCSRCEQPTHARQQCRGTCAACGFAWPDCHDTCPMRYDQSSELLMAVCDQTFPSVQTTDLDERPYEELPMASPMIGAALRSGSLADPALIPDHEVVSRYSAELHARFAPKFPNIEGMTSAQWMALLDAGQVARLCRAVAAVLITMERFEMRGLARQGVFRWDSESRAAINEKHCQLRDTVIAVAAEIKELLTTYWDI